MIATILLVYLDFYKIGVNMLWLSFQRSPLMYSNNLLNQNFIMQYLERLVAVIFVDPSILPAKLLPK